MENGEQTAQVQETVETAAPTTATEEQVIETPATTEGETEEQPAQEPPKRNGIEKRFSELTARAKAAEYQAQFLERQIDQMMRQQQPPPQQPQPPQGKPTREQFDYDEDRYLDALTDYKLQERLSRHQEEQQARQREFQQAQRQQDYSTRVEKANAAGVSKFADYSEVVLDNPNLVVSHFMADAISATDVAPDIAYHLGKHPDEAARIAQLPPNIQYMEIARIEAKLKVQPQKKTTSAPPPIQPVGARGNVDQNALSDDLPIAEWIRRRESQIKNR